MKKLLDSFVDKQAELIDLLEKHNTSYHGVHIHPSNKLIFSLARGCIVRVNFIKNKVVGLSLSAWHSNINPGGSIDLQKTYLDEEIYDWLYFNCYDVLSEEQKLI